MVLWQTRGARVMAVGRILIMDKKMETTTVYWGSLGIMEN